MLSNRYHQSIPSCKSDAVAAYLRVAAMIGSTNFRRSQMDLFKIILSANRLFRIFLMNSGNFISNVGIVG